MMLSKERSTWTPASCGRRVDFTRPDGSVGAYEAVVGIARVLPEIGCGPRLGEYDGKVEEYRIEAFQSVAHVHDPHAAE